MNFHKLSFSSTIWKILFDPVKPLLGIEGKDNQKVQSIFSVIDLEERKVIWNSKPKPYKQVLAALAYPLMVTEIYTREDDPAYKDVEVFELQEGKQVILSEASFEGLDPQGMPFLKKEKVFGKIDPALQWIELNRVPSWSTSIPDWIQLPHRYSQESKYFELVSQFLQTEQSDQPVGAIDYLETPASMIISYYLYDDKFYRHFLKVFDRNGQKLHEDCLDDRLKGIGSESFFIYKDQLVYAKQGDSIYFGTGC